MAVDVSVYNEVARNNVCLSRCVYDAYYPNYANGYNCGVTAAGTINTAGATCQAAIYPVRLACDLIANPWCTAYWAAIPTLPSVTGGLLVCDSSYGRCGNSCSWTVPAGAQYLRFQMWGAGAASQGTPCCCGVSMWGGSGAYASVILPAVPGCVYTLCAGCAVCCYPSASNGITTGSGCASYVTGYGLSGVCADGGEVNSYTWLQRAAAVNGVCNSSINGVCAYVPIPYICSVIPKGTYYGWCICSNGGFCWNNTCGGGSGGCIPFITSCKMFYGTVTNATQCCHFVIGTPGVFNAWCSYSANDYKCAIAPPVTCSCYSTATCGVIISADYNCQACSGFGGNPTVFGCFWGRGGYPSSASGGSDSYWGFPGFGGAVCVQYL